MQYYMATLMFIFTCSLQPNQHANHQIFDKSDVISTKISEGISLGHLSPLLMQRDPITNELCSLPLS